MQLNSETVTIRDTEFEVRELTVAQLLPALQTMAEDDSLGALQLLKISVHMDGEPIGDALESMPSEVFMKLSPVSMRVNNMGQEEEGND